MLNKLHILSINKSNAPDLELCNKDKNASYFETSKSIVSVDQTTRRDIIEVCLKSKEK